MSVLQRKELEESSLADLHAIASELGIDGYRGLRKDDLIAAILGGEPEPTPDGPKRGRRRGAGSPRKSGRAVEESPSREEPRGEVEDAPETEEAQGEIDAEPEAETERPQSDDAHSDADEERESVTGMLDVLPNGSGFLRVAAAGDAPASDVYISAAQIRRCELRAGDEVTGPLRPPRRNERHPSLVRVEAVDGRDAEQGDARPRFGDLTPVHPQERLTAPAVLDVAPFGKGSRVAVAGPPGAGATRLLREIVATLAAQGDLSVAVVLAGARPEEVTEWRREASVPVSGGSFDLAPDQQAQAAELAVERAKREVERGGDAIVVIDSLDALGSGAARRLFGAGRRLEEGGSLTIVAAVGEDVEHLHVANTRVVLEPGAGEPTVVAERSGTQRADLLR